MANQGKAVGVAGFVLLVVWGSSISVHGCDPWEFRCRSGECVRSSERCNGIPFCSDGSDEKDCPKSESVTKTPCFAGRFRCDSGRCVYNRWRCDQHNDCGDNSDEIGCPTAVGSAGLTGGAITGISIAAAALVLIFIIKIAFLYFKNKNVRDPPPAPSCSTISQVATGPADFANPRDLLDREPPPMYSSDMNIPATVESGETPLSIPPPLYSSQPRLHTAQLREPPPRYTSTERITVINGANTVIDLQNGPDSPTGRTSSVVNMENQQYTVVGEKVSRTSQSCDNIAHHPHCKSKDTVVGDTRQSEKRNSKYNSCPDITGKQEMPVSVYNYSSGVDGGLRDDSVGRNSVGEFATVAPHVAPRPLSSVRDQEDADLHHKSPITPAGVRSKGLPPRPRGKSPRPRKTKGASHGRSGINNLHKNQPSLQTSVVSSDPSGKPTVSHRSLRPLNIQSCSEGSLHSKGSSNTLEVSHTGAGARDPACEERLLTDQSMSQSLADLQRLTASRGVKGSLSSINTWNC